MPPAGSPRPARRQVGRRREDRVRWLTQVLTLASVLVPIMVRVADALFARPR